jgi:hypothetical protein
MNIQVLYVWNFVWNSEIAKYFDKDTSTLCVTDKFYESKIACDVRFLKVMQWHTLITVVTLCFTHTVVMNNRKCDPCD